jgi:hypothetical protein
MKKRRFLQVIAKLLLVISVVAVAPAAVITATGSSASAGTNCGEPPFNSIVPEGFFANTFSGACAQHDICYWGGTHGYPWMGNRLQCDLTFLANMQNACAANYGWWDPRLTWCDDEADVFFAAVRDVGSAYWAGNWWDNV